MNGQTVSFGAAWRKQASALINQKHPSKDGDSAWLESRTRSSYYCPTDGCRHPADHETSSQQDQGINMGYFSWKTHDTDESIFNHHAQQFEGQGQPALRLPDMALLPQLINPSPTTDLQRFANTLVETLVMRYDGHHNALIEQEYEGYGVFGGLDAHGVRALLNAPFLLGAGANLDNGGIESALSGIQTAYAEKLRKVESLAMLTDADTSALDEVLAAITDDQALRCASIYQSQVDGMPFGLQFTFQEPPSAFQPNAALSADCPNQGYFEWDADLCDEDDCTP